MMSRIGLLNSRHASDSTRFVGASPPVGSLDSTFINTMNTSNFSLHQGRTPSRTGRHILRQATALLLGVLVASPTARADETCMSPYMAKITGQEEYVYVWTLGIEGLGDGSDKLVT